MIETRDWPLSSSFYKYIFHIPYILHIQNDDHYQLYLVRLLNSREVAQNEDCVLLCKTGWDFLIFTLCLCNIFFP